MLKTAWAVTATFIAVAVSVLHFANPVPLIQIPDGGHRLYFVPAAYREAATRLLEQSGLHVYGTFTAGVRQTLFGDGITVIATATDESRAGISRVSDDPAASAASAQKLLEKRGIASSIWTPPEPELTGKLVVVKIPAFGWDMAYHVPGYQMPWPKWEK